VFAFLVPAIALMAAPDPTAQWNVVTASMNDGDLMLQWVDRNSIEVTDRTRDLRNAWTYFITRKEAIHSRSQFDCRARSWQISRITVELPDGTVTEVPGVSGWKTIEADTPLERVLEYVCSGGESGTDLDYSLSGESPVAASRAVLDRYYAETEAEAAAAAPAPQLSGSTGAGSVKKSASGH